MNNFAKKPFKKPSKYIYDYNVGRNINIEQLVNDIMSHHSVDFGEDDYEFNKQVREQDPFIWDKLARHGHTELYSDDEEEAMWKFCKANSKRIFQELRKYGFGRPDPKIKEEIKNLVVYKGNKKGIGYLDLEKLDPNFKHRPELDNNQWGFRFYSYGGIFIRDLVKIEDNRLCLCITDASDHTKLSKIKLSYERWDKFLNSYESFSLNGVPLFNVDMEKLTNWLNQVKSCSKAFDNKFNIKAKEKFDINKLIVKEERYDEGLDEFDEEEDEEYEEREPEKIESDYLDLTKLNANFKREPELDFEDDGSYFHIFSYGNVRASCLVADGRLYLTIHDIDAPKMLSPQQVEKLNDRYEHWELNGISLKEVDEKKLADFVNRVKTCDLMVDNAYEIAKRGGSQKQVSEVKGYNFYEVYFDKESTGDYSNDNFSIIVKTPKNHRAPNIKDMERFLRKDLHQPSGEYHIRFVSPADTGLQETPCRYFDRKKFYQKKDKGMER